ncbi:H(+)/Cl(-) exchange transporter 7-like [Homarus americanus]|uniref:Chloride channel protein n=1 Tax=Homarus americanus TaxID=6706 RepID=A0A8J5MJJ9_HOMAM|nr:H(+)/Cl(-) exchange transporter 7-like [Homarus americanus]
MIKEAYKDEAMSRAQVLRWHKSLKVECTSYDNEHHSGHPSNKRNDENVQKNDQLVHEDRRVTIREVAEPLDLSSGPCDFWFKLNLQGKKIRDRMKIQDSSQQVLSSLTNKDYQKWEEGIQRCIEASGEYFKDVLTTLIEYLSLDSFKTQHYISGVDTSLEETVDVLDGCTPAENKTKPVEPECRSGAVGNSIFYVDDQQESPSDENRGQLNMLSAAYESLDYDTCVNSAWLDEERTMGYKYVVKKDVARWLVVLLTAVLTALPVAAGSGIPQVKCYLNGVKVPRVVRIKTLVSKALGVIMSVLGGLAVGKEGPMIHSGAVIAAGVSQGKTTSFKHDFGFFEYFREDHEKRDFVSAGAAAGVAAAFGAPVGGVLFSLEEGASFWNQGLTWRVFFGAMMSTFTLNLVLSAYNGFPGKLNYNGLLNFGKFDDLTYEIWEFIPFLLMGVMGGLLGALYNHINLKLTAFRMRYIQKPWQKIIEAAVVAFVTAVMFCGIGEENAAAAIWFQTPERSVRSLFHDTSDSYHWSTIGVFFVCYFFLACWTYGLGIPAGLFIPTLLCGAAWGRLVGMLLCLFFPDQKWVDEGKYALVGAGAMLGGVVRMTLSLTVILMECVGNITFGLPLMIVLMVAKWVGDFFNEGIYDIHIQMQGVPIMAWDAPPLSNNIYASEVMNRPVVTLKSVERVGHIVNILKANTYNGFPVVDSIPTSENVCYFKSFGTLRGVILRSQLTVLLKHKIFNENAEVWQNSKVDIHLFRISYPRYFTLDEVDLNPEDMNCTVDLRPFYNPSPYSVVTCTALPRIFNLFRALGLRHLIVVNDNNEVVGMVTRKDLVKYRIWKHRGQMGLEELVIYNNVS